MRKLLILILGPLAVFSLAVAAHSPAPTHEAPEMKEVCIPPGQWRDARTDEPVEHGRLIDAVAKRPVVLLGEAHTSAEHHRWQLHTIAAIHARNPHMVIGFESFPRRIQPILEEWVAGGMDQKAFLKKSEWNEVWRYDASLYMPLFHFARMHGIPIVALNVDRETIKKVRESGLDAVSDEEREGVGEPAPAGTAYLDGLAEVFSHHLPHTGAHHGTEQQGKKEDPPEPVDRDDPKFRGFVAAQLTWDRAMAEALASARATNDRPVVVGIVGGGHLEYGYGIPHQLADLGITDAAVLLPWDAGRPCAGLKDDDGTPVADFVFGVGAPPEPAERPRMLLGVVITESDGGVHVDRVMPDSVAEKTGLKPDDIIVEAAGVTTAKTGDLIAVVGRQAPGTWLPLRIKRGDETLDVVAKFGPAPESP